MRAICIGVTRMSCWPMLSIASADLPEGSGNREELTFCGVSNVFPKPNFLACAIIFSPPTLTPPIAKGVLHDWMKAWRRETRPDPSPQERSPGLSILWVVPGGVQVSGASTIESGVRSEFSSIAVAVSILNVEPGAYWSPPMARLTSGRVLSVLSWL